MELVQRIRADNSLFEKLVQRQLLSSILVQYHVFTDTLRICIMSCILYVTAYSLL